MFLLYVPPYTLLSQDIFILGISAVRVSFVVCAAPRVVRQQYKFVFCSHK
jgi:hypothetical protein